MVTDNGKQTCDIFKGDIFKVKMSIHCPQVQTHPEKQRGTSESTYSLQFGTAYVLFVCVDFMQTNNGNFRAKDSSGKLHWFNSITDDIQIVKRK